jgi:MATE family multidrug resistance protein
MSDVALPNSGDPRMAWLGEARATLTLAWPIIFTNLIQVALTTTDVVMLGRLGPEALASGILGANFFFFFIIFGLGITTAVAPMIARERGIRRHAVRDVRRTVRQGLWSVVAITVPVWAVLWFAEPILLALGQDPRTTAHAAVYLSTLQWSYLPFLGYITLRNFVAALERPIWGLVAGGFGFFANAFTAWCLIFGNLGLPRLELFGAGIATTISSTAMFAVLAFVAVADRRFRRYSVFGRFWRADWPRFRQLWALGLPIAATLVFEVSIFNFAVILIGLIGETALAAHAIAIQISSVAFMVPFGFGQAATVRVGLAFGAGDRDAIARAGWTSFVFGVGFMAFSAILMLAAPRLLIGLFIDTGDRANLPVVELAATFLSIAAIFQLVDGAQGVAAGMLRGLHDTRVPMLFAALGYWGISVPVGVVLGFPLGLGGTGVWIGLATGLAIVAALMTGRWVARGRLGLVPPRCDAREHDKHPAPAA